MRLRLLNFCETHCSGKLITWNGGDVFDLVGSLGLSFGLTHRNAYLFQEGLLKIYIKYIFPMLWCSAGLLILMCMSSWTAVATWFVVFIYYFQVGNVGMGWFLICCGCKLHWLNGGYVFHSSRHLAASPMYDWLQQYCAQYYPFLSVWIETGVVKLTRLIRTWIQ